MDESLRLEQAVRLRRIIVWSWIAVFSGIWAILIYGAISYLKPYLSTPPTDFFVVNSEIIVIIAIFLVSMSFFSLAVASPLLRRYSTPSAD